MNNILAVKDSNCPVCEKDNNSILYYKEENLEKEKCSYHILRCNNCSHLFSFPSPAFKEPDSIYEESRAVFLNDLERANKKIKRLNSFWRRFTSLNLPPFYRDGKILDVGCNNGLYLYILKNLGWQVWGVEIDGNACKLAKELNINIFCGNLEEAIFSESFFDVVRLNQVLEHIGCPKKTIKEARRILKKDGKLYISVPNARSLASFLFKDAWLNMSHVQGFSPRSMRCFCEDLGLKIKSMRFSASKNLLIMGVNYFFKAKGKNIYLKNGFICRMIVAPFSFILNILHLSDTLTVEIEK